MEGISLLRLYYIYVCTCVKVPEEDLESASNIVVADDDFTLKAMNIPSRDILDLGEDVLVRKVKGFFKVSVPEYNSTEASL